MGSWLSVMFIVPLCTRIQWELKKHTVNRAGRELAQDGHMLRTPWLR